ncbi:MAG: methyltransferase domain-containing protein [Saprospiraceae bacterium]|nr:methyltransferase domain-containing protein [Saprospiraceae bacterium]
MRKRKGSLKRYCKEHTSLPGRALQDLERKTHLTTLAPQMISGHIQGRFLSMISHLLRPKNVLEIGTFTGYSAICLAEGLASDGRVHTIEVNPEYATMSLHAAQDAGFQDKIVFYLGDALELIPKLEIDFDLVFIDAAKMSYQDYFELIFTKVIKGGFILMDNLLWGGKVITDANDAETNALRTFAHQIQNDARLENILLPIRDGLMICRKV